MIYLELFLEKLSDLSVARLYAPFPLVVAQN